MASVTSNQPDELAVAGTGANSPAGTEVTCTCSPARKPATRMNCDLVVLAGAKLPHCWSKPVMYADALSSIPLLRPLAFRSCRPRPAAAISVVLIAPPASACSVQLSGNGVPE